MVVAGARSNGLVMLDEVEIDGTMQKVLTHEHAFMNYCAYVPSTKAETKALHIAILAHLSFNAIAKAEGIKAMERLASGKSKVVNGGSSAREALASFLHGACPLHMHLKFPHPAYRCTKLLNQAAYVASCSELGVVLPSKLYPLAASFNKLSLLLPQPVVRRVSTVVHVSA